MSGVITPLGEKTVGGLVPTTLSVFGAYAANLNASLAASGNMKAALNVAPPTVAGTAKIAATLNGALQAVVKGPSLGAAIKVNAAAIVSINAQLAAIAGILAAFGEAGVFAYTYDGTCNTFGTDVQAELVGGLPGGSPTDHVNALVLVTSIPAAWLALSKVLLTG
jgi:hypothetical protein